VTLRLAVKLLFASSILLPFGRLALTQTAPPAAPATEAAGDDSSVHEGGWKHTIEVDLVAEKFDDLDRMADEYRRDKSRLPGGDWKLRAFYEILDAPQLTDKDSVEHLDHLHHWMKLRPESITARVALATSLTRWAWVARGNGLANTVTPEGWRLFGERAGEAYVVLEGSRDMKIMCPQWYTEMMTVGLAQGWDISRVQEVFARGIQFEPDYQYLYTQYANYLLPKWYGKSGDSSAFAKTSADKLGDRGDLLYFQIVGSLIHQGNGKLQVANEEIDWPRVQRGYASLIAAYGQNRHRANQLAYMAFRFRDREVAQQQFAYIGDKWSLNVWKDRKLFDRARDWANGQTSWPPTPAPTPGS